MRTKFNYYYPPSDEREEEIRTNGFYVIDTNVLLDILRLGKDLAEKAIVTIVGNKDRVRVPFYVAYEYHKHFRRVIYDQVRNLEKAKENITIDQVFSHVLNLLENVRLPKTDRESLKSAFEEPTRMLLQKIEELYNYYESISQGLELQERIATTLDDSVLDEINSDTLQQYEAEAQKRYKALIPPGYKDSKKRDNKYGDYIIWQEILKFAKVQNCDIIFVSGDLKEDWQEIHNGKKLCPRYELQKEFQKTVPNKYFRTVTLDRFLEMLDSNHFSEVEMAEVKSIAVDMERIRTKPTVPITPEALESVEALLAKMDNLHNSESQIIDQEEIELEMASSSKKKDPLGE